MSNQEPAFAWPFGNGPVRVGTQGLFRPCLKTFVAPFLPARLTAPGSPRMRSHPPKPISSEVRTHGGSDGSWQQKCQSCWMWEVPFKNCTLWTNTKHIIFWIKGQSVQYKTFVASRASEIHQTSTRHVPTDLNCADDATTQAKLQGPDK